MNKNAKVRWAGYITAAGAVLSGIAGLFGQTQAAKIMLAAATFAAALGHILGDDPGSATTKST